MKKENKVFKITKPYNTIIRTESKSGWVEEGFYVCDKGMAGLYRDSKGAEVSFVHKGSNHKLIIAGSVTQLGLVRMALDHIKKVIALK